MCWMCFIQNMNERVSHALPSSSNSKMFLFFSSAFLGDFYSVVTVSSGCHWCLTDSSEQKCCRFSRDSPANKIHFKMSFWFIITLSSFCCYDSLKRGHSAWFREKVIHCSESLLQLVGHLCDLWLSFRLVAPSWVKFKIPNSLSSSINVIFNAFL